MLPCRCVVVPFPRLTGFHCIGDARPHVLKATRSSAARSFSSVGIIDTVASSGLVRGCEKILLTVHETCGTPWWATITITVFSLRCLVTMPFAVIQRRIMAKIGKLKPEMDKFAKELAAEIRAAGAAQKWSELKATQMFRREMGQYRKEMWVKHNCHPAKAYLVPWFQIPLWVGLSFALRNLSASWLHRTDIKPHEDMQTGGLLWFRDLTVRDKTWMLPVLYGVMNVALCEMWLAGFPATSIAFKAVIWVSRVAAVIFVPIAGALPSAVPFYWLISSLFGLLQFLLMMSPKTLRLLRIPPVKMETTPYRNLLAKMMRKPIVSSSVGRIS